MNNRKLNTRDKQQLKTQKKMSVLGLLNMFSHVFFCTVSNSEATTGVYPGRFFFNFVLLLKTRKRHLQNA